jgi:hypothetical protein
MKVVWIIAEKGKLHLKSKILLGMFASMIIVGLGAVALAASDYGIAGTNDMRAKLAGLRATVTSLLDPFNLSTVQLSTDGAGAGISHWIPLPMPPRPPIPPRPLIPPRPPIRIPFRPPCRSPFRPPWWYSSPSWWN